MSKKQTPLTYEAFERHLLPKIGGLIDKKISGYRIEVVGFKVDMQSQFGELKEQIRHLPTKEEYYAREDKTMNELKKLVYFLD